MLILNKQHRAKRLLANLSYLPQSAEQIEFLSSCADFKQQIVRLIRSATRRIYITALYFEKDEAGQEILHELYQAKQQNPTLEIKILVDWHRAQRGRIGEKASNSNADWYSQVKLQHSLPANEEIEFYGVPINGRELFGVLHLKGFVFDDTLLYSGASINNVYLQQFERYRYDRYHCITNPQLADSFIGFIQQAILSHPAVTRLDQTNRPRTATIRPLIKAFRKQLSNQSYTFSGQSFAENKLLISPLVGLGRNNPLNHTIEALLFQAEQKVTICTPYFNFPRSIHTRIKWLLENGREIEIIVGDKTANDFYTSPDEPFTMASALPYLYEKNLRAFAKRFERYVQSGQLTLRLWQHDKNSYHLKGVWIDNNYILLTGNNLNPRAWALDAENALLISDPNQQLCDRAERELQQIRTYTRVLTDYSELETLRDYPEKVQKLLKKFGRVKLDKIVKMLL